MKRSGNMDRLKLAVEERGAQGPTSKGEYKICCPFCLKRSGKEDIEYKLHANPNAYNRNLDQWGGWWFCYRCGARGGGDLTWLGPVDVKEVDPQEKGEWAEPPEGFEGLDVRSLVMRPYVEYLKRRCVWAQAQAVGVGVCLKGKYRGRVVIPMKDGERWRGFSARLVGEGWGPKYLYPPGMDRRNNLWGAHWVGRLKDGAAPLWLVEGVFDALPLYPFGLAAFGKGVTDQQIDLLLTLGRPIYVCLDGDAWRDGEVLCARLRMRGANAGWVHLPPATDPGTLGWKVRDHIALHVTTGPTEDQG